MLNMLGWLILGALVGWLGSWGLFRLQCADRRVWEHARAGSGRSGDGDSLGGAKRCLHRKPYVL